MKYRREFMKRLLAFALALNVCGLSLSCLAICADHAEQSSCSPGEINVTLIELEGECCSLDTLRSLPPERIHKTPAGHIIRPLPPVEIFGFYHCQTRNMMRKTPQPTTSPPLQRLPALRI
jgi:hypothetical protein